MLCPFDKKNALSWIDAVHICFHFHFKERTERTERIQWIQRIHILQALQVELLYNLRWKQLVSMLSLSASILSSATPFNMGYAFKKLYVHMREQSAPLKIPYTPVSRTTRITSRFSSRQKVRLVCSHT